MLQHKTAAGQDFFKRESKLVGHGEGRAIVEAEIHHVHGVSADRFLRCNSVDETHSAVPSRRKHMARYSSDFPEFVGNTQDSSSGLDGIYSRSLDAAQELKGVCELLKRACSDSRIQQGENSHPFTESLDHVNGSHQFRSNSKSQSIMINEKSRSLKQETPRTDCVVGNEIKRAFQIVSGSDLFNSTALYATVCQKFGVNSASELETLLADMKVVSNSSTAIEPQTVAQDLRPIQSPNISTPTELKENVEADAVSIALYLNEENQEIVSDNIMATVYKSILIDDLCSVLQARPDQFDIRGLFEGVVVEIFIRGDVGVSDPRSSSQLAEELTRIISSKELKLRNTRLLQKSNTVKIRGLASKARPLALILKKLESTSPTVAQRSEPLKGGLSDAKLEESKPEFLESGVENIEERSAKNSSAIFQDLRNLTVFEVGRPFSADKSKGQLELFSKMKIVVARTDGAGWCFGNIVGLNDALQYPGGWFPAECVARFDPIDDLVSDLTLETTTESLFSLSGVEVQSPAHLFDVADDLKDLKDFDDPKDFDDQHLTSCKLDTAETCWQEESFNCKDVQLELLGDNDEYLGLGTTTHAGRSWALQVEVVEARSLPEARAMGLLPDTYVCISSLHADHGDSLVIDHCISNEPAVEDRLPNGLPLFRIPPQARTRVFERSTHPQWRQRFRFLETRPKFSVAVGRKDTKKLVSTALEAPIRGQEIRLLFTVHEQNPFGGDCWIGRSELFAAPMSDLDPRLCLDQWISLQNIDGSPIWNESMGSNASLRVKVRYGSEGIGCPEGDFTGHCEASSQRTQHLKSLPSQEFYKRRAVPSDENVQRVRLGKQGNQVESTVGGIHGRHDVSRGNCNPNFAAIRNATHNAGVTMSSVSNRHSRTNKSACQPAVLQVDFVAAYNIGNEMIDRNIPDTYFCISLINYDVAIKSQSKFLNHDNRCAKDHQGPEGVPLAPTGLKIRPQYESDVILNSQTPKWTSRITLSECVCAENGSGVEPLAGQPTAILISMFDKERHLGVDSFLGKVLISKVVLGEFCDRRFNLLDLDGNVRQVSDGYLHVRFCYGQSPQHVESLTAGWPIQTDVENVDLSASTSSTDSSETSFSSGSSPGSLPGRLTFQPHLQSRHSLGFSVTDLAAISARSEETESSILRSARSVETNSGVFEPASSLIRGNSFASEQRITNEFSSTTPGLPNFNKDFLIVHRPELGKRAPSDKGSTVLPSLSTTVAKADPDQVRTGVDVFAPVPGGAQAPAKPCPSSSVVITHSGERETATTSWQPQILPISADKMFTQLSVDSSARGGKLQSVAEWRSSETLSRSQSGTLPVQVAAHSVAPTLSVKGSQIGKQLEGLSSGGNGSLQIRDSRGSERMKQHPQGKNELSELQKVFLARKLIHQDLS